MNRLLLVPIISRHDFALVVIHHHGGKGFHPDGDELSGIVERGVEFFGDIRHCLQERGKCRDFLVGQRHAGADGELTPPTIEIVGFLGGAARFITKPCLKQRVMRFPTIRYGCSV